MICELNFERVKNSKGESANVKHFIIDDDTDAENLPKDAATGSDAFSETSVFVKFPSGWRAI